MILEYLHVKLDRQEKASDARGQPIIVRVAGFDYVSVSAVCTSGTWSSGVVSVRKANQPFQATLKDYASPVTLTAAAPQTSSQACESEFIQLEVTTAESNVTLDIFVHLRTAQHTST